MAAQTVDRMVSAAFMFALGLAAVSARPNKRLLLLIKGSNNREIDITYTVFVQYSENFDSIGMSDVVNSSDWNTNVNRRIAISSADGIKFEKTCEELLENPAKNPKVAFVAELTETENSRIVPPIEDSRWHRIYIGKPTLIATTPEHNMYNVQLKIFDRLVFFTPVNKFGDEVDLQNIGVATFDEISRMMYLKEEGTAELCRPQLYETADFDYKTYFYPGQMIAMQYDKENTLKPSNDGDWIYYKLVSRPSARVIRAIRVFA